MLSDPFKLKDDGSNYILITHVKMSKSNKGDCTESGLLFSISGTKILSKYIYLLILVKKSLIPISGK